MGQGPVGRHPQLEAEELRRIEVKRHHPSPPLSPTIARALSPAEAIERWVLPGSTFKASSRISASSQHWA